MLAAVSILLSRPVVTSFKNCFHLQIYLLQRKIRNDNNNGMEKIKETRTGITLVHTKLNSSVALCVPHRVHLGLSHGMVTPRELYVHSRVRKRWLYDGKGER